MVDLTNKEPVYRVVFGMYYDVHNEKSYRDNIFVKIGKEDERPLEIEMPVYAQIFDGKLIELITGKEIPRVLDSADPGFGGYSLTLVYTLEDYKQLSYYLDKMVNYKEQYSCSLNREIEYLNKRKEDFYSIYGAFDKFSSDNEDANKQFQTEYDGYVEKTAQIIGKLYVK